MGHRWLLLTVVVALMLMPAGDTDAVGVSVSNSFPEYIMEDHINLTGRATNTSRAFVDDSSTNFNRGTNTNLTVDQGSVVLKPTLEVTIQNNGSAVLSPGTGTAWDTVLMNSYVLRHNGTFYMYYTGARSTSLTTARHIGLATSSDGVHWTKYSGNPVLRSRVNSYDWTNIMQPVVLVENGTFHMLYSGNHGNTGGGDQDIDICYANSSDGYNWTKYSSNPVIKNSATSTDWDGIAYRPGDVVRVDEQYLLYVKGVGSTGGQGPKPRLGLYYSTDLRTWTEEPKNPLYLGSATSWELGRTNYLTTEMSNGTFRIWTHSDASFKVGWMSSADGFDWADSGSSLIDPTAGTIYSSGLQHPRAIKEGDHYDVWITCKSSGPNVIGLFKVTPKKVDGTFTSRVHDTLGNYPVTGVSWARTTPGGSAVDLYIRWTNDTSDWPSWTPLRANRKPIGVTGRYYQYRAVLSTPEDWNRPSLDRFQLNIDVPVSKVEVSVDGGPWQLADGTATKWYKNVSLHDGDYDIRVRATDQMGSTDATTVPVQVDLFPPTGSILIEDGRTFHNSSNVKIDVEANDTHGPIEMQMSRTQDFSQSTWWPHYPSNTYGLLDEPEGNVTIYLRLRDAAGRLSETYSDSIFIDTTPPEGTLLIDEGAKYTNSTTVTLRWNATDLTGVVAMMASNHPDFEGAIWEDPMNAFSWPIGDVDGVHNVYLKVRDIVGWETVLTDDIILDRTPPSASLVIDRDASYTTSSDVTLNVTFHDEHLLGYKIANDGEAWPDSWRSPGPPVDLPWTLLRGADGGRTVRLLVRDAAGNGVLTTDDIILDTTPPSGYMTINGGNEYTTVTMASVFLSASDATSGLDRMRISSSDDLSGVPWQSLKENLTWQLGPGDGPKYVFVQLRDNAGLVTTLDDSIILDATPPSGTVSILDVGERTADPVVTLIIDVTDEFGLAEMRVSADPSFYYASWTAFTDTYPWDLGIEEGEVMVFVEVTDMAGNLLGVVTSTVLDLEDPVVTFTFEDEAEYSLDDEIGFSWSATDSIGLDSVTWWLEGSTDRTTFPLEGMTSTLDNVERFNVTGDVTEPLDITLVMEATDLVGRRTTTSAVITYVPELPAGALEIDNGEVWTNSTVVSVFVTHAGGLTPTHFRVATSEVGLEIAEWTVWGRTVTVDLLPPGGDKTVYGQIKGRFDLASGVFSDDIRMDVLAPEVVILSPLTTTTEEDTARLSVSVADDQDAEPVVMYRLNGGEWRPYIGEEKVPLREGDNLIEVTAQDAAGNVGTTESTMISEQDLSVGGASWLILVVILIVVACLMGLWYWRARQRPGDEE